LYRIEEHYMETLNTAFFFVTDKIIELQAFFLREAWNIGRIVLVISLSLAAINYALSGQGLKENLVKIGKAVVFFIVVMNLYPAIIGRITEWTFQKAYDSTYGSIAQYVEETKTEVSVSLPAPGAPIGSAADLYSVNPRPGITTTETTSNPYFTQIVKTREYGDMQYSVVAPAAVMEIVLLVAGDCIRYADNAPTKWGFPNFGAILKGLLCGLAVMVTGIFAMIEYLLAFLEFMLVTSVGIILFPLSLWEGTKFMAEKLIGAIMGFFIKLLFCNICIFLLLFGYISLLRGPAFTGRPEEILILLFISLIFFYICKSAPGLAQSLLTGTPSLSAAGAIGAVGGAIGMAAGAIGMAKTVGGAAVGGVAKTAFTGAGAISQAIGAKNAAYMRGGSGLDQAGAFMDSLGSSMKETALSAGDGLTRSLLSPRSGGRGGGGSGFSAHSQLQQFNAPNETDGSRKTLGQHLAGRRAAGAARGNEFMDLIYGPEYGRPAGNRQQHEAEATPPQPDGPARGTERT
jgi:hypothetical protein